MENLAAAVSVGSKARHRKGRLEDMNAAEECIDALQAPALVARTQTLIPTAADGLHHPSAAVGIRVWVRDYLCSDSAKSDGSMHMLSEKVWRTSSSNKCNPSSATEGARGAYGNMDHPTETTALT